MKYSIIIPIFNEITHIPKLLDNIQIYSANGHEIIIIDDGSNDGSYELLLHCNFIKLYNFKNNQGKGVALKKGISKASNEKLIIFDGDLELHPKEIDKLMILDKKNGIMCVFANRYQMKNKFSAWTVGNTILTFIFNYLHNSDLEDALCCAKSFYKSDIRYENFKSLKFDIDVEISSTLVSIYPNFKNVNIEYKRRGKSEGKKLRLVDSFKIIFRIFRTFYNKL